MTTTATRTASIAFFFLLLTGSQCSHLTSETTTPFNAQEYRNHRQLAIGDFDQLNVLFDGAELILPDFDLDSDEFDLGVRNLVCRDVVLGDMISSYTVEQENGQDVIVYRISAKPFQMTCVADFSWKLNGFFSFLNMKGDGDIEAITENNEVHATIKVYSPTTFAQEPPNSVVLGGCESSIRTDGRVQLSGGPVNKFLNIFRSLISDAVDDAASDAVCDELGNAVPSLFGTILNMTNGRIDEWQADVAPELTNPLFPEQNFTAPAGVTLLNFRPDENADGSESIGDMLVSLFTADDALFGETEVDPTTGELDLGINVFFRNVLLDDDGVLRFNAEEYGFNPVVFESHDNLTDTLLYIEGVEINGLDTLETFASFEPIGDYTIANSLRWQSLNIKANITMDLKPSSLPTSIFRTERDVELVENIIVDIDLTDLNVDLALFMAIDEGKFNALQLGSLLTARNILPCLMGSMAEVDIAGLNVTIGDMSAPLLTDFASPGLDRFLSRLAEAVFVMYEPSLLRAMPGIFQGPVREIFSDRFLAGLKDDSECPEVTVDAEFLDFRNLFLQPDEAKALGATGERVGDLGHLAYSLIQDRLTSVGPDGNLRVNSVLVRPMTESQSGTIGLIQLPDTLFEFSSSSDDSATERRLQEDFFDSIGGGFDFSLGNIRISNLDTIVAPIEILNLTESPYTLRNRVNLAGPLGLTINFRSGFDDYDNDIDVSLSVANVGVFADLFARLKANSFLGFSLGDVLDYNCWMAAVPSIALDAKGFAVDDASSSRGFSVEDFSSTLSSLTVETTCIDCQSPGSLLLSALVQILQDTGSIGVIGDRAPDLMDSVMRSSTTQTSIDRMLADAPRFCKSSPEYDANAERTEFDFVGFPTLSSKSIDTVLFTGLMGVEMATVMFAETQRLKTVPETDPLSAQRAFEAPEGVRLLDWTDLGNSTGLGGVADQVFDEVRLFLGGEEESVFDVDNIVLDLLGENGILEFKTNFAIEEGDLAIRLETVRVEGLDGMAFDNIFEPIGPQTLATSAQFPNLKLEFIIEADSPSTADPPQQISVSISVNDLSADIAIFAAFDVDRLGDLELGSIIKTSTMFNCILSAAHAFEVPQMKVSLSSFSDPVISGLQPETQSAASRSTNAMMTQYKSIITEAIPNIFDGVVREMISSAVGGADNSTCDYVSFEAADKKFVDFRDLLLPKDKALKYGASGDGQYGDLLSTAFEFLEREIFVEDKQTGMALINTELISSLTKSQSGLEGRLFFEGDIINQGGRLNAGNLDASFKVRVFDAFINNLDTFGVPLQFLDPVQGRAHALNNSAVVGVGEPLRVGLRLYFQLSGLETTLENELEISFDVSSLRVLLRGLVKMSESGFMQFPVKDLTNLDCWMSTIPPPELDKRGVPVNDDALTLVAEHFVATVASLGIDVSCIKCNGGRMEDLVERIRQSSGSQELTDAVNGIFDFVTGLVEGNYFKATTARALKDAPLKCPHNPLYDPDFKGFEYEAFDTVVSESAIGFFLGVIAVGLGTMAVALIAFLTVRCVVHRRHRKWLQRLSFEQVHVLRQDQLRRENEDADLNALSKSMFTSSVVPLFWRLLMPIIIVGNVAMFLSGHLSLGASVSILGEFGGETFSQGNFFQFSMLTSTMEIWNAGARELAILIFIFSFAWPYSKQLMTFGLWFAPPKFVSVHRRGDVLLWLDFLAKWSMVDVFVLVIAIVTFRISIKSPQTDYFPDDIYSLDLLVVPKWGLYANMTAQIISQLSSHVIIHYHRKMVDVAQEESQRVQRVIPTDPTAAASDEEEDTLGFGSGVGNPSVSPADDDDNSTKERLCDHAFTRPHRGESDKLVVKSIVKPLLVGTGIFMSLLMFVGCFIPSYSLNVLGIVGLLVETGQNFAEATTDFSVFSTITLLFEQARLTGGTGDYLGLGTLCVLLVLSVLVVPILQAALLLVQWFVPMSKERRQKLSVLLEILQAWQYAEVYLLAILTGSWQIGPLSAYMINPYCQSLNGLFAELAYYDILRDEDAQCLRVDVQIEPTFYVLFCGAVLLAIMNAFVMNAVSQYVRDHEEARITCTPHHRDTKVEDLNDLDAYEGAGNTDGIHPAGLLFTDRFRWLLLREDTASSSSSRVSEVREDNIPRFASFSRDEQEVGEA